MTVRDAGMTSVAVRRSNNAPLLFLLSDGLLICLYIAYWAYKYMQSGHCVNLLCSTKLTIAYVGIIISYLFVIGPVTLSNISTCVLRLQL